MVRLLTAAVVCGIAFAIFHERAGRLDPAPATYPNATFERVCSPLNCGQDVWPRRHIARG